MITAESSAEINRRPEEVFAFVTDASNDPAWHTDILEASRLSDAPIGVGSRFRWVMKFMGRKEAEIEIVAFDPPSSAQARMVKGPVHPTITYRCEPARSGTRFSRRIDYEPEGMYRLMAPMMASMIRKRNGQFVENLRRVLEQRPTD